MDIYFTKPAKGSESDAAPAQGVATPTLMGSKIDKIICRGNVKIVRGENISYSQEAVYAAAEKKILLSGRPKLVIYSTEDIGAAFGN